jgi:hypothetical protein
MDLIGLVIFVAVIFILGVIATVNNWAAGLLILVIGFGVAGKYYYHHHHHSASSSSSSSSSSYYSYSYCPGRGSTEVSAMNLNSVAHI